MYYRRLFIRFLVAVFKQENAVIVYDILAQIQSRIRQYILGLLLEMVIVSSATCLALWIVGVDYAILLGLLTGLFNIIPYIGIISATLLSVLVTFATAGAAKPLLVIGTTLGIHLIDSNVLLPVIVGSKVRINAPSPFWASLSAKLSGAYPALSWPSPSSLFRRLYSTG